MMEPLSYVHPAIEVRHTGTKGRGLFTRTALKAGTLLEVAPVIVMSSADRKHVDETLLHDYIFEWGPRHRKCCMALGYVSLYNHGYHSNCEYEMDFDEEIISIRTVKSVDAGTELLINYNGQSDDETPLWFETQ